MCNALLAKTITFSHQKSVTGAPGPVVRRLFRSPLHSTNMLTAGIWLPLGLCHYNDVIMGSMASQITSPTICLLSRLFGHRSKKTSKLRVTGLYAGTSPANGEFLASNAENVSIWWRHHAKELSGGIRTEMVEIPTGPVSPPLHFVISQSWYIFEPTNHKKPANRRPYIDLCIPTENPTATRLGLCNILPFCMIATTPNLMLPVLRDFKSDGRYFNLGIWTY